MKTQARHPLPRSSPMSSHTRPKLTVGEISGLIGALPLVFSTILAFLITSTWAQWKDGYYGGNSLRRNAVASFGTMITHLKPRQVRALIKRTTGESVEGYCAAHQIPLQSVLVSNDDGFPPARLHFVACRLEQKSPVLLYFQYARISNTWNTNRMPMKKY